MERLRKVPTSEINEVMTCIFSVKESAFKAISLYADRSLDFLDFSVWPITASPTQVLVEQPLPQLPRLLSGVITSTDKHLLSAVALSRSGEEAEETIQALRIILGSSSVDTQFAEVRT
jgi:4'-phosphopantetheinyl transferase EntD